MLFFLPPAGAFCLPPAGNFLSVAKESTQRTPAETHGFCTSFLCTRAASEVPPKRGIDCLLLTLPLHCEGERDCCSTVGNPYVPAVDASFSSPEPGAAAGLLLRRFPLWPITNETLESKGSPETIGLWRLFCPLFQLVGKVGRRRHVLTEVTRRRQQRQRASQAVKGYRHKYSLSLP